MAKKNATPKDTPIEIATKDLPFYCPPANTPRWNMHPRVFLDVAKTREATCPYCGAHYKLKDSEHLHPHTSAD